MLRCLLRSYSKKIMELLVSTNEQRFEAIVTGVITEGYAIADGFLSPEEARQMLQAASDAYHQGQFNSAGIGKTRHYQMNQDIRRDHIQWIDHHNPPEACRPFFSRLQAMSEYFNRSCYLGIRDMELHFAIYPEGAFYKRHLDVFRHTQSRKLSVVCYLNFDWNEEDGGQLRLYLPQEDGSEKAQDILPLAGRLVCFNSQTLEHEVLPARRTRHSVTGWLKDEARLF